MQVFFFNLIKHELRKNIPVLTIAINSWQKKGSISVHWVLCWWFLIAQTCNFHFSENISLAFCWKSAIMPFYFDTWIPLRRRQGEKATGLYSTSYNCRAGRYQVSFWGWRYCEEWEVIGYIGCLFSIKIIILISNYKKMRYFHMYL